MNCTVFSNGKKHGGSCLMNVSNAWDWDSCSNTMQCHLVKHSVQGHIPGRLLCRENGIFLLFTLGLEVNIIAAVGYTASLIYCIYCCEVLWVKPLNWWYINKSGHCTGLYLLTRIWSNTSPSTTLRKSCFQSEELASWWNLFCRITISTAVNVLIWYYTMSSKWVIQKVNICCYFCFCVFFLIVLSLYIAVSVSLCIYTIFLPKLLLMKHILESLMELKAELGALWKAEVNLWSLYVSNW